MKATSPTSSKPLLLMDIDGVLNCFGDLGASLVSFEQEFLALERYTIRVPYGAREGLHLLQETFEPMWCSTWEEAAHPEIGVPLGLREWPYIDFQDDLEVRRHGADPITLKLARVIDKVGEGPVAWVDDDLQADAHAWATERNKRFPTLLVQPRTNYGLEAAQVNELLAWAVQL